MLDDLLYVWFIVTIPIIKTFNPPTPHIATLHLGRSTALSCSKLQTFGWRCADKNLFKNQKLQTGDLQIKWGPGFVWPTVYSPPN